MVKKNVNVGDLREFAQTVLEGRIKTFHLELRKTGKSKDKLYAEYTTHSQEQLESESREMRMKVSELLEDIADSVETGIQFNSIQISKVSHNKDWQILIDRIGSHA